MLNNKMVIACVYFGLLMLWISIKDFKAFAHQAVNVDAFKGRNNTRRLLSNDISPQQGGRLVPDDGSNGDITSFVCRLRTHKVGNSGEFHCSGIFLSPEIFATAAACTSSYGNRNTLDWTRSQYVICGAIVNNVDFYKVIAATTTRAYYIARQPAIPGETGIALLRINPTSTRGHRNKFGVMPSRFLRSDATCEGHAWTVYGYPRSDGGYTGCGAFGYETPIMKSMAKTLNAKPNGDTDDSSCKYSINHIEAPLVLPISACGGMFGAPVFNEALGISCSDGPCTGTLANAPLGVLTTISTNNPPRADFATFTNWFDFQQSKQDLYAQPTH